MQRLQRLRAIKTLQVGERVTTTSGESTSVVDPATWQLITVQMPNPECPSDILDIEMLRAPDWLDETGCEEGEEIWLELEEMGLYGWAEVRSIAACPPIQEGTGRIILATITHSNTFVMELKFEGQSETLNLTDRHSLFSITQNDWVPASQLKVGEELRTFTGSVRIESVSELQSLFRVYNLEVEGDHSYLAGSAKVLSHNAKPCGQKGGEQNPLKNRERRNKERAEKPKDPWEKEKRQRENEKDKEKSGRGGRDERPEGDDW